jgi:hypothetical protein
MKNGRIWRKAMSVVAFWFASFTISLSSSAALKTHLITIGSVRNRSRETTKKGQDGLESPKACPRELSICGQLAALSKSRLRTCL